MRTAVIPVNLGIYHVESNHLQPLRALFQQYQSIRHMAMIDVYPARSIRYGVQYIDMLRNVRFTVGTDNINRTG